jgi:hypothetical protein
MAYKAPGTYARFVKTASSVVTAGGSRIMALVGTGINYYTVTNEAVIKSNTKPYDTLANENVFEITSVSSRPIYDNITVNNTLYSPTTGNNDGYTLNGNTIVWDSLVKATCSINAKQCPRFYYNNGTQNITFGIDETVEKLVEDGEWMIEVSYVNEDDQDLGADEKLGCYRVINMNTSEIIGEYVVGSSPATDEDGSYPIPGVQLIVKNTYIANAAGRQLVDVGDYVIITTVAAKTEKEAQVSKVLATNSGSAKVNLNLDLIVADSPTTTDAQNFTFGNIIGADNYTLYISDAEFEKNINGDYDTSKAYAYSVVGYDSTTNTYSLNIPNNDLKKYAISYTTDPFRTISVNYSVNNDTITLQTSDLTEDLNGYTLFVPYKMSGDTKKNTVADQTDGFCVFVKTTINGATQINQTSIKVYPTDLSSSTIAPLALVDDNGAATGECYIVEEATIDDYDLKYSQSTAGTTYYKFIKNEIKDDKKNVIGYTFYTVNSDSTGTLSSNDESSTNEYLINGVYSDQSKTDLFNGLTANKYFVSNFSIGSDTNSQYYIASIDVTSETHYVEVDFDSIVISNDDTVTVDSDTKELTTTYINNQYVLTNSAKTYLKNSDIDVDTVLTAAITFQFDNDSLFVESTDNTINTATVAYDSEDATKTITIDSNTKLYDSENGKTINNVTKYIKDTNNKIYISVDNVYYEITTGDSGNTTLTSTTTKIATYNDLISATNNYNYLLIAYDANGNIVDYDADADKSKTSDKLANTSTYYNNQFYNAISDLTVVSNGTIFDKPAVYELTYTREEEDGKISIVRYVNGELTSATFDDVSSLEDDYFEVIPGIEFSLDGSTLDSQITTKGTTATVYIVTSPRVTSTTMPAEGATYYVSYKYRKAEADYEPTLYTDYDDIVAAYGNYDVSASGAVLNSLSLGAEIAFNNGVSQIVCVQAKNGADYEIETAIDKLSSAIAGASNVQTIIPLSTSDAVGAYLQNHVNLMSSYEYGKERMGYLAARPNQLINKLATRADRTVGMAETAEGYADERIVYVVPGAIKKSIRDLRTGKYNTRRLDGCYAAVAVAAIGLANDAAEPLTNKTIAGFTELVDLYSESEKNILAAAGCCVLEPYGTNIRIRHGITTATDEVNSQEITLIQIKDYVIDSCRNTTANLYIGKKLTSSIIADIKYTMNSLLSQFVSQGIIIGFSSLKVVRNSDEPRQIDISFEIEAVYPLNWISIEFGFSSTSF